MFSLKEEFAQQSKTLDEQVKTCTEQKRANDCLVDERDTLARSSREKEGMIDSLKK